MLDQLLIWLWNMFTFKYIHILVPSTYTSNLSVQICLIQIELSIIYVTLFSPVHLAFVRLSIVLVKLSHSWPFLMSLTSTQPVTILGVMFPGIKCIYYIILVWQILEGRDKGRGHNFLPPPLLFVLSANHRQTFTHIDGE